MYLCMCCHRSGNSTCVSTLLPCMRSQCQRHALMQLSLSFRASQQHILFGQVITVSTLLPEDYSRIVFWIPNDAVALRSKLDQYVVSLGQLEELLAAHDSSRVLGSLDYEDLVVFALPCGRQASNQRSVCRCLTLHQLKRATCQRLRGRFRTGATKAAGMIMSRCR